MQVKLNQGVPAEPNVSLATDVYLPSGRGPFPAILTRTPYGRAGYGAVAKEFVANGLGFVVQDVRGKYDSGGNFTPLVHEAQDGQATIDWVANQRWCNGRVGLWGQSYLGMVQIPAASGRHEALRCVAPSVSPASFFADWIRHDGCYALANTVRWVLQHGTCRTVPAQNHFSWDEVCRFEDLALIASVTGVDTSFLRIWAEHDRDDQYWQALDHHRLHAEISVPGLHVGGWFDHISRGQIEAYTRIRDHGFTEQARTGQRLVLGPWGHMTLGESTYGDWDFGPEAAKSPLAQETRFFNLYLNEIDDGYSTSPPVQVFLMGPNRWQSFDDWPPPGTRTQEWHLDSDGNGGASGGHLALETPKQDRHDHYTYDPRNPVPTHGGPIYWGLEPTGPVDQRPILGRSDVLCYRSAELNEPVSVIGEATLDLVISTTAEDTDVIAKLCVEEPTGEVVCATLGSLRCRYRKSFSSPTPMVPGEPVPISVRFNPTAYVFPQGSRIVLLVTSSDFPRINAHPNSMAPPFSHQSQRVADVHIYHGPTARSRLSLPTIPEL